MSRRHHSLLLLSIILVTLLLLSLAQFVHSSSSSPGSVRPTVVASWTTQDVISWMKEIGLEDYVANIQKELIDGESIFELTPDEWEQHIGITKLGHKKKLEKGLKALINPNGPQTLSGPQTDSATNHEINSQATIAPKPTPPASTADASVKEANEPPSTEPATEPAPPITNDKSSAATKSNTARSKPKHEPYVATPLTKKPTTTPPPEPPKKKKKVKKKPSSKLPVGTINVLSADAADDFLSMADVLVPKSRPLTVSEEHQLNDLMRQAIATHHRSEFQEAKELYLRALKLKPDHTRALHMLGLIAIQYENNEEAAFTYLKQSLAVQPDSETYINLGNLYWGIHTAVDASAPPSPERIKALTAAMIVWKKAIDVNALAGGPPFRLRFADTLYTEALRLYSAGSPELTKEYLEYVVILCTETIYMNFPSDYTPFMNDRMTRQYFRRDGSLNLDHISSAPEDKLFSFLSISPLELLKTNGETNHSLRLLLADAYLHLGMLHSSDVKMVVLAYAYYQRALQIAPDYLDRVQPVATQIATVRQEAIAAMKRVEDGLRPVTALKSPEFQQALNEAYNWVMMKQISQPAQPTLGKSPEKSKNKKLIEFLHKSCKIKESWEIAQLIGEDAIFQTPQYAQVHDTNEEVMQTRAAFEARLDAILADPSYDDKWHDGAGMEWCRFRFYLAYHGLNNINISRKLSQVYWKTSHGVLDYTSPHLVSRPDNGLSLRLKSGKIKVGFISAFLTNHPVGKTLRGYILNLPRDRFEIYIYFITLQGTFENGHDQVHNQMKKSAHSFHLLPPEQWPYARATIEADRPDILIYGDIGMEPTTYFLAFSRLAPIQAMTFGHPDSSGIPQIDYFLSHRDMDVEDDIEAQKYYSETLVRLPGVGYWYPAAVPPTPLTRDFYGVSDRALQEAGVTFDEDASSSTPITSSDGSKYTLYLVTKSVQFFSPDFMDILAGILYRHPRSFLALVMETGKNTKGYQIHNVCLDQIYDGIEKRIRQLKKKDGKTIKSSVTIKEERERELIRRHQPDPFDLSSITSSAQSTRPWSGNVLGHLVNITTSPSPRSPISGRIRFVDRGDQEYFMNLLRVADVLLQPTPLDGTTTTLEAVTVGTPTVLHRSSMIGGRMGWAIYQHMGITDTLATSIEEYISIAVRLGTDPEFSRSVRAKLKLASEQRGRGQIFEDTNAIDAYVEWIEKTIAQKVEETL